MYFFRDSLAGDGNACKDPDGRGSGSMPLVTNATVNSLSTHSAVGTLNYGGAGPSRPLKQQNTFAESKSDIGYCQVRNENVLQIGTNCCHGPGAVGFSVKMTFK